MQNRRPISHNFPLCTIDFYIFLAALNGSKARVEAIDEALGGEVEADSDDAEEAETEEL
jgi:hypothetical protein